MNWSRKRGDEVKKILRYAIVLFAVSVFVIIMLAACSSENGETDVTDATVSGAADSVSDAPETESSDLSTEAPETESSDLSTEAPETEETVEEEPVFTIKTEYCDLKFPEKWQGYATATPVEEDPYTVKFAYMDGTPLFDIVFGEADGTFMGTLKTDEGDVPVYYVGYEIDENNIGYFDQLGIQDSADVILQNLKKDYEFTDGGAVEITDDVFGIETSFVTLYYPKKWEDTVTVSVGERAVSFIYGNTNLFDICFEQRDDGAYLGTYDGTPVYAVSYNVDPYYFTDGQYRDICAMQDDVNVILEYLKADEKFE